MSRERLAFEQAERLANGDPDQARSWAFALLYAERFAKWRAKNFGHDHRELSRRGWVELLVRIEDKRFEFVRIRLNQSQRNLEAMILRQERAGQPVRIVIVKVRQNGISTFILAVCLWLLLTKQNKKLRVVCDRDDLCKLFLHRLRTMLRGLTREDGTPWSLVPDLSNRDEIVFGEPFHSGLSVVSANTPSAGFGETMSLVSMEETSKWGDARETAKGVLMTLPALSNTYAFDVSQPRGNTGYFAEKFQRAWRRKQGLGDALDPALAELADIGSWQPTFFPWFLHDEYRWSRVGKGGEFPEHLRIAIESTLDEEEKVLLLQKFTLRGDGKTRGSSLRKVDFDQLAWRRYWIETQCNGSLDVFHEQCPAFVEEAFLASGRPAFNMNHVKTALATSKEDPQIRCDIIEAGAEAA